MIRFLLLSCLSFVSVAQASPVVVSTLVLGRTSIYSLDSVRVVSQNRGNMAPGYPEGAQAVLEIRGTLEGNTCGSNNSVALELSTSLTEWDATLGTEGNPFTTDIFLRMVQSTGPLEIEQPGCAAAGMPQPFRARVRVQPSTWNPEHPTLYLRYDFKSPQLATADTPAHDATAGTLNVTYNPTRGWTAAVAPAAEAAH